jgi:Co/Zn/Cd efflux system component/copper chaperone CopZ
VSGVGPARTPSAGGGVPLLKRRVIGIDCATDAAAVERAVRGLAGIEGVRVSAATQIMSAHVARAAALPDVERAVARVVEGLGYRLAPWDATADGAATVRSDDDDAVPLAPEATPPGYVRALWLVVALNLGYGVIEAGGGFWAESQALKADALDFLGDGAVTLLATLAVRWSLSARARVALAQGAFLLLLALGVFANTLVRVVLQRTPEAELMGAFAAAALLVNLTAALVLVPYRKGQDVSARTVWRFSAADAAGNALSLAAALLVGWTGSPIPDLVVAFLVGGLFFRSAWAIICDARADLREVGKDRVAVA